MKRGICFVLLFLMLVGIFASFAFAQIGNEDYPGQNQLPFGAGQWEKTKQQIEEEKWDYLSNEWNKILKKNPIVSGLDAVFTKTNIVFRILFGQDYSLSLTLFFVIFLWFYFLFGIKQIFTKAATFNPNVSLIISAGLSIILAQLQILRKIVDITGWFILSKTAGWWRFIAFVIVCGIFMVIFYINSVFADTLKKSKEEAKKQQAVHHRKLLEVFAENLFKR